MSSSEPKTRPATRRRALALLAATVPITLLAGCLRPMLAETGPASEIAGQIDLPPVRDRLGRIFTNTLEDRLGRPVAQPPYRLEVERSQRESGLLVAQDNAVTRVQIRQRARYRLFARGSTDPILSGNLTAEGGFDQTASLYASRTTKRDVEERLARDLAERIARRLQARAPEILASGPPSTS